MGQCGVRPQNRQLRSPTESNQIKSNKLFYSAHKSWPKSWPT